ncbi:MAG TPA: NAD-glutamate dehydrogenase domain-containing protein, partial [Rhodocyclaceae bacterium]|nr:NAD-glutamate dehydrogenase domain-containing protein [Rhodocyclaceae bacterium]
LVRHPAAARALIDCFQVRFDPARQIVGMVSEAAAATANRDASGVSARASGAETNAAAFARLDAALQDLHGDEERRVFKLLRGLLIATLRTNFYSRDAAGNPPPAIAFKFDGRAIEGSPAPTPLYEIFVHSPRVEGIHLRGGKVARGGIRWSDRYADYRTEVHGLFKAQMVKNVVIVPEGAKGGFVVRRPPAGVVATAAALREEAVACYRIFIGSLLDLTDNLVDGRVVPPAGVVRHDGDDTYLVVAADKGTATFSDIANGIAVERGFWLGDAFASGGSAGYDHKALAITARGTWEAVKRHFRELGVDAEVEPISVAGVGDMSGDVFGNGLLLSPQMRLVGAFDHRHIFIDPNPDATRGAAERRRLFALPTSSWDDFDRSALGAGGAIYRRDAASIALSVEAQQRFALPAETTPAELMRAILRAEVDLLWLGGIGTYVRASDESDGAVGDRANDGWRVSGGELRCKVVGEGANLGCTQRGRIEYAKAGGRIDTDAIDNAGGVSCSDHEVNLKILFTGLEAAGALTRQSRDVLLADMSDEVCALVLGDVARQTEALSIALARAPEDLGRHARLLRFFERNGQLDRRLAGLPEREEIIRRRAAGEGLTRPELAVLLAHTKVALFAEFIASDLPDEALLEDDLFAYFPQPVRHGFPEAVRRHPLRREIVTTALVNSMVDRVGSGFVNDLQERTGEADAQIARAYLAARRLFGMEAVWGEIAGLDTAAHSAQHRRLMLDSREIVENATLWLLRQSSEKLDLSASVQRYAAPLAELLAVLPKLSGAAVSQSKGQGSAPADRLDQRLRLLCDASRRLDVLLLAERRNCRVDLAAQMMFAVDEVLALPALDESVRRSAGRGESDALAAGELLHAAADAVLEIATRCLHGEGSDLPRRLSDYLSAHRALLSRYHAWRAEIGRGAGSELASAVLAVEALRGIAA